MIARRELIGSAVFAVIGIALIALAPAKQSSERPSAVVDGLPEWRMILSHPFHRGGIHDRRDISST